jgi:hypothetical protein
VEISSFAEKLMRNKIKVVRFFGNTTVSEEEKEGFSRFSKNFFFSTLFHLPSLNFHGAGGCWD